MKIKDGFKLRTLVGEHIVTREGYDQVNFNKMISLNESAAYLWKSVAGRDFDVAELASLLVKEYGIDQDLARHDAQAIADKWVEIGLVEA